VIIRDGTHRRSIHEFVFETETVDSLFVKFCSALEALMRHVAQHTTPTSFGDMARTAYKPDKTVSQEEYDRQLALSKEANLLATIAWRELDSLAKLVRTELPETLE
jgi:hypothetical protein